MSEEPSNFFGFMIGSFASWIIMFLVFGGLWGCPRYNVWQQEMSGRAEFAKAEQNRRIKVEEAKANLEAEKLNAEAEVERARGVAESNTIIGEGLRGNEMYIRYLWVKGLTDGSSEVIYVPTEANIPIMEAQRLK
jgi:hypothetical protein